MTNAYWCVLIAAMMPYIFTFIAKFTGGRYNNYSPREFLEKQEGFRKRANWAQMNSFEAFPAFAAAVIIAHLTGGEQGWIDTLAMAFIALRVVYGALYTLAILVFGYKFMLKYRHNRYEQIRTGSVMFFQLAFAFLIPEIMYRLNSKIPYYDLKSIWPLNYYNFERYRINQFIDAGDIGLALLISFNPNSSLMCAPNASVSDNSFATVNAVSFLSPLFS